MKCYTCDKSPDKTECGKCREVLKIDLVRLILELDPVYLSELNRNKKGRPSKTKDAEFNYQVAKRYKEVRSYRKVAEEFGIGKSTVANIVKGYGSSLENVE